MTTTQTQLFYVTVRQMPMNHTYTVRVLARTLEEAKQKAIEWPHFRAPGANEYLTLA